MSMLDRVRVRLHYDDEEEGLVSELLQTTCDRIMLRAGEQPVKMESFPEALASIAVDVTVKAYRRVEYEGITSEGSENMTSQFVEDILAEYAQEIDGYKSSKESESGGGKVRFL